ncbi:MAG: large ribosomal subunit protein uL22 [Brevinematia bacterium]
MEATCKSMYLKISQKKMIRFINVVRGRRLDLVLNYLDALPHKGAKFLAKALRSAYANLVYKGSKASLKDVYVKDIKVNQSFSIKRVMPRARGSADIIKRRFSSIYVVVSDEKVEEKV